MIKQRSSFSLLAIMLAIFSTCITAREKLLPTLPDGELDELATKLLTYKDDFSKDKVLMKQANEELNLTLGKPESPNMTLLNTTDRTLTKYGHEAYRVLLENPSSKLDKILQRQSIIKHLTQNPELLAEFDEILSYIARHQENVFMLWSLANPFHNRSVDLLTLLAHATGTKNSKHGLEALRYSLLGITGAITVGLTSTTGSYLYCGIANGIRHADAENYVAPTIVTALTGLWCWKAIPAVKHQENISKQMQELMISVGTTLRAARALNVALEKVPNAQGLFVYANDLKLYTQETKRLSDDLQELMEELKTSTFKGNPSFFSHMGRVRTAFNLATELKDSLIPLLKAIGEVDAFVSPAKLYLEYQTNSVHYSFVEFVNNDEHPLLIVEKSWNPVIKAENIITEDLALGTVTAENEGILKDKKVVPNVLLTGPHGGGKSTIMRQLAYCVVFSQVFGMAPCDMCKITPFSSINTYLDIKDNMDEGKSTFMAERERIDYLKRVIRGLAGEKFGFTIIDELFKGTMETEASRLVSNFIEKIEQVTESIVIMSSHFVKPAIEAEERENRRFFNFHMDTQERTPGRFKRNFKLIEGRCDWWFNDHDKRGRYVKWLQTVVL